MPHNIWSDQHNLVGSEQLATTRKNSDVKKMIKWSFRRRTRVFCLKWLHCAVAPPMHHHVVFKSQPRLIFKLNSLLKVTDTYNVIGDNQPQERKGNLLLHLKFSEVASSAKLA